MLSRLARINILTARAARKYGPNIIETAGMLEELIALVKAIDPLPKRVSWPLALIKHLSDRQQGICPLCRRLLKNKPVHVDHVVPWAQGGGNSHDNIRLLHQSRRCHSSLAIAIAQPSTADDAAKLTTQKQGLGENTEKRVRYLF